MCKQGLIHVCMVIDSSGSMYGSKEDVVGGFNKTIDEQRAIEDGECIVSLYTFNDDVKRVFLGKSLDEIKPLTTKTKTITYCGFCNTLSAQAYVDDNGNYITSSINTHDEFSNKDEYVYSPDGCTAMNDGIGIAIDEIGKWLADMPEEERPSKNLIVIMTDGMENASKEYSLAKVREMIKHQTEVYNWSFVYMGTDITTTDAAEGLGINMRSYSSRATSDTYQNYTNISVATSAYRCGSAASFKDVEAELCENLRNMTASYEVTTGVKIEN